MVVGIEHRAHLFLGGAHDFTDVHVGRDAGVDFLGTTIAALADRSCGDQTQHVKVGDQTGNSTLGQWVLPDVLAGLAVNVVHLAGLDVAQPVLFVEKNRGKHQFLLAGEGGDHGRHLVGFNLTLGDADVVLVHDGFAGLFGFFC